MRGDITGIFGIRFLNAMDGVIVELFECILLISAVGIYKFNVFKEHY